MRIVRAFPCHSSFSLRSARLAFSMAAAALLLLPIVSVADTITLKNGDHLTGTVTQLAGGKLAVTTTYAGALTISWDEVTNVKLDKPLVLSTETKAGKRTEFKKKEITGVERTSSGFTLSTTSGSEAVPATGVTTLRSTAEETAYEASLHPNALHGWTGGANLSIAVAAGNSETTTIGAGVTLVRPTPTDKTSLYYNTLYTHDGVLNATTANLTNAGARYDHNINPKLFGFGTADFNTNALQDLDLRTIVGGGIGWHAIAKPVQQLDVLAGLVWTHENYSAVSVLDAPPDGTPATTNSFAALDLGEQYTRKLGANSALTEQAFIFPDLNDTSQYRFTANAGLNTKIYKAISWQSTFSDIYVTNPPAGTKDNDIIFTTGIGFNFTRK